VADDVCGHGPGRACTRYVSVRGPACPLWQVTSASSVTCGNSPGNRLPSEATLQQQYGLARETVRRAVAVLRAEGLVVVHRGHGAVVSQRMVKRRGPRRALVAVMHKILTAVWHMLSHDVPYHDLGLDYFHRRPDQVERRKRRLLHELTELGIDTSNLIATS
jgi:DNA-binding transcriptional regulator YhcF (GntR family)